MKKIAYTLIALALLLMPCFAYAQQNIPEIKAKTTKTMPVRTAAQAFQLGGDTIEVVVRALIHPDHYIYANVDPTEQILTTEVKIAAPKGVKKIGNMEKPQRHLFQTGSNTYIYKDDCIFRQLFRGTPKDVFKVTVKYECHNAQEGFQPQQVEYRLVP